jgi:hypothetical protein
MKKLIFIVGAAAGYVLGTRAGRERYQQIADGARRVADQPTVQQAQTKIKDLASKGTDVVTAKLHAAATDDTTVAAVPEATPDDGTRAVPDRPTTPTTPAAPASTGRA